MIDKNITVKGFLAGGLHCGIKEEGRDDLALIFSTVKAQAAGVFTTNAFKAPPVELDEEKIKGGLAQAIITNSGNANAATGKEGLKNAKKMSQLVSHGLKIPDELVLVASTGVIGKQLPMEKIVPGIATLIPKCNEEGILAAQRAIMTTDKFPKVAFRQASIGGSEVRLCTIAKGAGMIQPNMATLLSYTLTDVNIAGATLNKIFRGAIAKTLNCITVDGCMSTNDTALVLANGCAGNKQINKTTTRESQIFQSLLEESLREIAEMIVSDGEGATKVIEIVITEAPTKLLAKRIAYAIGNSSLVKTAFYGCDPNMGRIIGAIGAVSQIAPDKVTVTLDGLCVFTAGTIAKTDISRWEAIMRQKRITVSVSLASGKESCRILASDLSHEYVDINAHYLT
ncbi:MAG: bifunctional glutamate N-acetyltransferase/amino-acid acetyltransferase ArgJ [Deltaproteobacteria bacterium]|nr:bifunctional glutamate N-acetyltransferase/amino-acid acetyltransferase ArgJ [Deltaproteobacteria bacterium]